MTELLDPPARTAPRPTPRPRPRPGTATAPIAVPASAPRVAARPAVVAPTAVPQRSAGILPIFRSVYRPDIEGLRAIAVLGVIAFHASVPHLAGGFVGVDVFFVISGFLITSLLLTEAAASGRVSIKEFYARRARRILPSAALALVVTAGASLALLPPLRVRDTAIDLAMSALYAGNWRFISTGTDYLAETRDPSPVLHYWSLAVEEQFYLLWPVLILACVVLARRLGVRALPGIVTAFVAATVLSLWLSLHWTQTSAPLAYLSSPSRAWQFGVGALLAAAVPLLTKLATRSGVRVVGLVLGWAGLLAVVVSCVAFDSTTLYPGTAALVPTLGTAAMVLGGIVCGTRKGAVGELLQTRALRAIGRLSFAWYLWHWPAIVLVQARFGPQPWPVLAVVAAAAVVPAWLTLRLVERPIRFNRTIATRSSSGIAVGVTATVLAVVAALSIGQQATATLVGGETAAQVQQVSASTLAQVFGPSAARQNSGPVTPSALAARTDFPSGRCISDIGETQLRECHFGSTTGPQAVLFGDSHAHQWQPAFQKIVSQRGWGIYLLAHAGCPADAALTATSSAGYATCGVWRQTALARIRTLHPSLVIVSSYAHYLGPQADRSGAWKTVFDTLAPMTKRVVYLADTPSLGLDAPTCISGHLDNWGACRALRSAAIYSDPLAELHAKGQARSVSEIDLDGYLCPGTGPLCPTVSGGVLLYRDGTHMTATLAGIMAPALAQALTSEHLMAAPTR